MDPVIAQNLLSAEYRFAKTMPENPHWYTLRKTWADDQAFVDTVLYMREHGYAEMYEGRKYTMYNLNGWKYWTMGAPINNKNGDPCTILINKKPLDYAADYDLIANRYDSLFADEESHNENLEIFNRLAFREHERVLDIGCGTGLFIDYCRPQQYVGIDPSRQMLERFVLAHPVRPGLERINARFEEFYDGEGFDLIVSLFGAANYIDPASWHHVTEMLQPGGRIFAMFYQERYVPVTYAKAGVAFPHRFTSDYDLSGFALMQYKDTYLIAEYKNFKYKLPSPSSMI